jgi:hypothetical protein
MITEEQEADRIVEKCFNVVKKTDTCLHTLKCPNAISCQLSKFGCEGWEKISYSLAIQDRQSVLEAMTELLNSLQMSSKFAIQLRINNLNNQISYLKSKI